LNQIAGVLPCGKGRYNRSVGQKTLYSAYLVDILNLFTAIIMSVNAHSDNVDSLKGALYRALPFHGGDVGC
jgi:hypothetical protein